MKCRSKNRGFVALISVIIVSAVLLATMLALSTSSFFARFDELDTERASEARALARSCAHIALARIAQNANYIPASGGDCVSVSGACGSEEGACKICSVTRSGNSGVIEARAVFEGAYANIEITGTFADGTFTPVYAHTVPVYEGLPCAVP